MINIYRKLKNRDGGVYFLTLMLIFLIGFVGTGTTFLLTTDSKHLMLSEQNKQALYIAEGGMNKAIQQLLTSNGAYLGEVNTSLGKGVFDVVISTGSEMSIYKIVTTAYIPNKANPKWTKEVVCVFNADLGRNHQIFDYAIGVDERITLGNTSGTNSLAPAGSGHIHSNGNIELSNSVIVNGDACAGGSISTKNSAMVTGTEYEDVLTISFPQIDMDLYKLKAQQGGTINGDLEYSSGTIELGPKYITGDLLIDHEADITLIDTVYVEGNVNVRHSGVLKGDKILCTEGTVKFEQFAKLGSANRLTTIISNNDSEVVVNLGNSSATADCVLYAPNGGVKITNSAVITGSIAAKTVDITNGALIVRGAQLFNSDLPGSDDEAVGQSRGILSWEEN